MCAYEQQEDAPDRCPTGTQFPVPADDLHVAAWKPSLSTRVEESLRPSRYGYADVPSVLVTDRVKIPRGLKGDYVLSWRWDCEQTNQVWNSCADITVV